MMGLAWGVLGAGWFGDIRVEWCGLLGHIGLELCRETSLGDRNGGVISVRVVGDIMAKGQPPWKEAQDCRSSALKVRHR